MLEQVFVLLSFFENFLWAFLGVPFLMLLGIVLTVNSGFFQIRKLPQIVKIFISFFKTQENTNQGVHPLKAFFACIGGSVGVGNVVGVCTAVQLGGPGALFWVWLAAIAGMIVKYAEVYLGIRYRVKGTGQGFNGGPMYFLRQAFKSPFFPGFTAVLLCVYGVEVFQFSVVSKSISHNLEIELPYVVATFLALILFAASGGVRRVGAVASALIPIFVALYVGMGGWVLWMNLENIPLILKQVFTSAFNGHAAVGAFAGSSVLLAASQGVKRGCYCGDIGIGYASIIHAETSVQVPERQAALVIFEMFVDTFVICTTSVVIILATGVWKEPLEGIFLIQTALSDYFPYMNYFMPFFLFLVGYATINGYFCVGLKCAQYLLPKHGRKLYFAYAILALIFFSFFEVVHAQSVMAIAGGLLLLINSYGIYKLRHQISFNLSEKEPVSIAVSNVAAAVAD